MSFSQKKKVLGVAESLLSRIMKKDDAGARSQKARKLCIDHLEERQMLSLTVATTDNLLVNSSWQDIRGDVAVDSNEAGDVVVAWTAADRLANPDYDPNDPTSSPYLTDSNGNYVEDLNIYGRYLTDEVQIITIPEECVPGTTLGDGTKVQTGSFELIYNAHETQRLSIFSSNFVHGEDDTYSTTNSQSVFYLGLYAEGELTWVLYRYDSNLLPSDNAANLQETLRAIPGNEYKDVVVTAYSETDFDITFYGDNWAGYDLTDIRVSNDYYSDVTALIDKVGNISFDVSDLKDCSAFQKLCLQDLFGANTQTIAKMISSQGRKSVLKALQVARDSLVDNLTSGVVSTVNEVQSITSYNSKGQQTGIVVDADPYKTAQNIQNAFNNVSQQASLYAPITRGYEYNEQTHRFEYTNDPTRAYSSAESYGSMQSPISPIEVVVEPVAGTTNQFRITFTGASGLTDQDALFVSAATYATKVASSYVYTDVIVQSPKTGAYEYVGAGDYDVNKSTVTVKQSSNVFRVNSAEVADFVLDDMGNIVTDRYGNTYINGTGRTDQSKPDVAISADGSFVVTWQSENSDVLQSYNRTDIYARRFETQAYLPTEGEGGFDSNYVVDFYENGTKDGYLGIETPDGFVADPYSLNASTSVGVQCVAPVANEFVVNASLNGSQVDPAISADLDGAFMITWTYLAQDNSYFGGIYGRQFNNDAEPMTGDITFASSQVGTNYYGPSTVAMSDDGFAVVLWNYGTELYQSVLEPCSDVFIVDGEQIASNAYSPSVDFDYNERYAISYTQEETGGVGGTTSLPVTDVYVAVYGITKSAQADEETAFDYTTDSVTTTDSNDTTTGTGTTNDTTTIGGLYVGQRKSSTLYENTTILSSTVANAITVGDQGRPSVSVDADGDVLVAYQGFGMDIHSVTQMVLSDPALMYSSRYDDLFIQLKWSDFEDNNLVYENKQFLRGQKYSYESKNEDLIQYIKLALGWGYDKYGDFTDEGVEPIYTLHNYDCVDADSYIKFFVAVAQKEGATDEQIMRLTAVLESLLSPLRNNGNDISYVNYGQTLYDGTSGSTSTDTGTTGSTDTTATAIVADPTVVSGVVSDYRSGSNACFYLALPSEQVASASLTLQIGLQTASDKTTSNAATAETVTLDLSGYYNSDYGYLEDYEGLISYVQSTLSGMTICGGDTNSFVVRLVSTDELDFYEGTYGEIGVSTDSFSYPYKETIDNVEYTGIRTVERYVALQITAQNNLHDTPLYIRYDYDNSSLKMRSQDGNMDYAMFTSMAVERYGSIGASQVNAHSAATSNGDVVVVWSMQSNSNAQTRNDVYPSIGNSLDSSYTHIYFRSFSESTDTAGPIVTNFSTPDGTKIDNGNTVTSALKDVVVYERVQHDSRRR